MPAIILHQWFMSPFCAKVRKTLLAKGLPFEIHEYPGLRAMQAKRLTGAGKLPVIDYTDDAGHTERVQDSSTILRFLERKHPEPPLWPADPKTRALAHFIEDWADESLFWFEAYFRLWDDAANDKMVDVFRQGTSAFEGFVVHTAAKLTYRRKLRAQGLAVHGPERITAMLREHLDRLEELIGEGPWLVGSHRTFADIAVAAQLDEFVRTSRFADEIRGRATLWTWLEQNRG